MARISELKEGDKEMIEMILGEAIIIGSALTKADTPVWLFVVSALLITEGFIRGFRHLIKNN